MKLFITTMPRQEVYWLMNGKEYVRDANGEKVRDPMGYIPVECDHLRFEGPCCYPVIPLINAYVEPGDEVRVLALLAVDERKDVEEEKKWDGLCKVNYDLMEAEVKQLCESRGVSVTVESLNISMEETTSSQLKLFEKLISQFQKDSCIYADLTFGTKPAMYTQTLALNYANQVMHNVYVGGVVYGLKLFTGEQKKFLYDLTKLFLLSQITHELGKSNIEDPLSVIRYILSDDEDN